MEAATKPERSKKSGYGETTCAPLRHPLRVRILEVANCRDISPIQFVNEGLQPEGVEFKSQQNALSHVAYHFRELEKAGCIKQVDAHQRRGATEHVYRGTSTLYFSDEEFEKLSHEERRTLSRTSFQGLMARADSAMQANTFDARTDRWLAWVPLELDARGWAELTTAMAACFAEVQQIRQDARERLAGSDEGVIPATFGMVGFESPAPVPDPSL
jgi:hypothetical protein